MNVKLDENVPVGLAGILHRLGHHALTVVQQGLAGQPDSAVWQAARREKRLLITMDLDFADIRRFPPGPHGGLLILRPSRQGRAAVRALLENLLAEHSLDNLTGCTAVADDTSIRVRRR